MKVLEQDVTSAFHTLSQVKTKPTQKSLRCEYNHRLQIKSVKVDCQLSTSDILLCNYPLEILMFHFFSFHPVLCYVGADPGFSPKGTTTLYFGNCSENA